MGLLYGAILGLVAMTSPFVSYRSQGLVGLTFEKEPTVSHILDDEQDSVEVNALVDQFRRRYWYRYVDTEVCLTGECNRIEVGIVWDLSGDFKGIEIYKDPLTKTDHSVFKPADYAKLISILENDWSVLREYSMEDLTEGPGDKVDGTSGATKKEISEESVENAVYTTFTLWHLIHQGEKEQLAILSSKMLSQPSFLKETIAANSENYQQLILNQYVLGNIAVSSDVKGLIAQTLSDPKKISLIQSALEALSKTSLADTTFQNHIGRIYATADVKQKVAILSSLKGDYILYPSLYAPVAQSLDINNEWLAIKVLSVLSHAESQSKYVLDRIKLLKSSSNAALLEAIGTIRK
ncbi:hypothetical protein [Dyadobacter sp. CY323]|uniref:hypothetical protein n=1 Tax=Dyadobacter sp. CY323 TaxID=2907302 RepID=UPI001F484621|nr:hypothetical protein [Dyadobacter sp. CY323]MCE6989575.1 hypothetical protein [Dyadobacter sp. CY323]